MTRFTKLGAGAALMLALATGAASAAAGPFLTQAGPDLWRASRLVGVDVLGPDGRKLGTVVEVLLDHDGRAAGVVLGVGGFLGLGQKDVALPFAQVRFTDVPAVRSLAAPDSVAGMPTEPGMAAGSAIPVETPAAQSTPSGAALGGPVGTTAGVPGGTVTGMASAPVPAAGGDAPTPTRDGTRPDHGIVDLTAEQLKAAPGFTFAR